MTFTTFQLFIPAKAGKGRQKALMLKFMNWSDGSIIKLATGTLRIQEIEWRIRNSGPQLYPEEIN